MQHHVKPATPLQGFNCATRFYSSVQGVQHEAGGWAEKYGFTQKIVALYLQPNWKNLHATHIGPHGHRSLLCYDAWYAVYWDYSDLPSQIWKQTPRLPWLPVLCERGVTPTTADQIKFDDFITSLQNAPAWREENKLEKAERTNQKEEFANGPALGLGPCSLQRQKHTLRSYLMGWNEVGRQLTTGTWRPTIGPAPQRRCKAPGGTCYAPVPKKCSKGMCTPHFLSFQIAYASALELVCHANTKSPLFDTGTHHVPLMQWSSHLGW